MDVLEHAVRGHAAEPDVQRTRPTIAIGQSSRGTEAPMHRSRPFVFVVLAAAAACSRHDPTEGNDILSQDRTLSAHLGSDKVVSRSSLPNTCGAIIAAAAPTAANQQQAEALTQQAGVAEMHGNIQDARALLRRASALDATNKSAAYHLGRTSEALGDRTTAMSSYCRYLALAPTAAESVEARQRLTSLSRSMARITPGAHDSVAPRGNVAVATPRPPAREQSSVKPGVVASAAVHRPTSTRSSAGVTAAPSVDRRGSVQSQPVEPQTARQPTASTSTEGDDTRGGTTAGGDVVASRSSAAAPDPVPAPPRAQRGSSIGVQSAIIGAATGAIFGAATGRSVKSTVIGAAAGGVLGTVVGHATRPSARSIRS
jgi:hypothetical protein